MSHNESHDVNTSEQIMNITDIVMRRCSATRGVDLPANTDLHIQLGLQPYEGNNNTVSVTLTITSSPDQDKTDEQNDILILVEYLLVTDEQIVDIPDELAHRLVDTAWPYLKTTLDTMIGMARLPILPMPLLPPNH